MPKISIIIPVYNAERYLKECLDSVINQTLQDIEIICIDDKSTDSSLSILKEYAQHDSRFVIVEQKKNFGAGISRNVGINMAKGNYIGFVDPDDYIASDMYEKLYKQAVKLNSEIVLSNYTRFNKDTKKSTFCFDYYKLSESKQQEILELPENQNIDKVLIHQMLLISPGFCWMRLYNTKLIKENKIYFSEQKCFEDNIFVLKSHVLANNISYTPNAYYFYREHNQSLSHKLKNDHVYYLLNTIQELFQFLSDSNLEKLFLDNFSYHCINNVAYVYKNIESKQHKKYLVKNIKKYLSKYYFELLMKSLNINTIKNFSQKCFSIKNSKDKTHKIITILGIKIKFKSTKAQ